jgi:hypothetical protein
MISRHAKAASQTFPKAICKPMGQSGKMSGKR